MTHSELTDNLTFVSAVQMLRQLTADNVLTEAEAEKVRTELVRRLRPTI